MAAPIVSGAVSLYLSYYPEKSREALWGDLIYSVDNYLDLDKTFFNVDNYPILDLKDFDLTDTLPGSDGDGMADANETVEISVTVRNTWTQANDVYVKLAQSIYGDTSDVTILKDSVYFGSISTYATKNNEQEPFLVRINGDCFNNRVITLNVIMKNLPDTSVFIQPFNFKIYNGEEISGLLDHDTIFTPDKFWLINSNLRVGTGVTLTILPGTHVQINAEIDNRGFIDAVGTPDSLIMIEGTFSGNSLVKYASFDLKGRDFNYGGDILENCIILNGASTITAHIMDNCYIGNFQNGGWGPIIAVDSIKNCYIKDILVDKFRGNMYRSVIDNLTVRLVDRIYSSKYSVYNEIRQKDWPAYLLTINGSGGFHKNTFLKNYPPAYFVLTEGLNDIVNLPEQYWGTTDDLKIKPKYYDFWSSATLPILNYEPILTTPSDSCPGHVWKVLVNGKDAQDEYVDPVGVGPQRFDVYFNRPMDPDYTPEVSFGVRWPYTQQAVADSGRWSPDYKIWTAYKTINLFTGDGINRIRVAGARDPESWEILGWEIPVEDDRFEFLISTAASSSLDFMATPGLGKVNLEWSDMNLDDLLGFNMYRMEHITDTTLTNPALINASLITDTLFTDYNVEPNSKYYYFYKVVRTDLTESDSSRIVSATPFTSAKGDANGDLSVNVSDVVSTVSYILMNNPQPFIFEAADMNTDYVINVLDVTGIVNEILNPAKSGQGNTGGGTASVYLLNDTLYINTDVPVAGIQFTFHNIRSDGYTVLPALSGFERASLFKGDTLLFLAYSMTGKTIGPGLIPVIKLASKTTTLDNIILSNAKGASITSTITDISDLAYYAKEMNSFFEIQQNYPNPFRRETVITYWLERPVDEIVFTVHNSLGQTIEAIIIENPVEGINQFTWIPATGPGLYFGKMSVKLPGGGMAEKTIKMIVQ